MKELCPICDELISKSKLPSHLALNHEAYENGEQISTATLKSLMLSKSESL